MKIITLDFESFYSDDYTLSKMTTESYVRDPRFEAHGCAIKMSPDLPARWWSKDELPEIFAEIDWTNAGVLAHHAQFDGLILSHCYGVKPKFWFDTLSMARLLLGNHLSVGLDALAKHFGLAAKTVPYNLFKGKRWHELPLSVQQQVGDGACHDVELTWQLFNILAKTFPRQEYEVVDTTIKMFTDPALHADVDMLAELWESEATKKQQRLAELNVTESDLQSAERFAQLLRDQGIEPETKEGKNGPIYAFAKTDDFMRDLQEHDDERVQALAEARLGVKSTLLQTRAETLGFMAGRGPLCVYLRYAGAGTLRVSGGDGANWLNFKRSSAIRKSVLAPDGYLLAPIDSSQIECVAEDEVVLTDYGPKAIQDVTLADRVWDGIEWVKHEGVVCKGTKQVISYQGLTATPEHIVYVRSDSGEEKMEMRFAAAFARDLVTPDAPPSIRETPLRKSFLRRLQDLWCPRNKIQVQECSQSGDLRRRKATSSRLSGSRDRSHRQRRPLRARQFATVNASQECEQSLHYLLGAFARRIAFGDGRFQTPIPAVQVWSRSNQNFGRKRVGRRSDYLPLSTFLPISYVARSAQERLQASTRIETKTAKVYDIVNAGPRHRFTVSGVLVSNCRVLHYLAGGPDEPVIRKFRNGEDPYVDIATEFYREPIYKPKKDDPRKDEMEAKRGMGKQGRLMCGYGAAGPKFKATAKAGLYGPRVDISLEDANAFVALYRDLNPSICARNTGYWAQAGRMLARLGGGDPTTWGPLTIKDKRIYLPEGQPLIYDTLEYYKPPPEEKHKYGPYAQEGHWRVKTRHGWKELWGSKLVQNVCEAVSRVIVSQALIRITRMGYRVLNWPYDELLVLIPKDGHEIEHAERCKAEMLKTPSWLPDLPLDAEYTLAERYSK